MKKDEKAILIREVIARQMNDRLEENRDNDEFSYHSFTSLAFVSDLAEAIVEALDTDPVVNPPLTVKVRDGANWVPVPDEVGKRLLKDYTSEYFISNKDNPNIVTFFAGFWTDELKEKYLK